MVAAPGQLRLGKAVRPRLSKALHLGGREALKDALLMNRVRHAHLEGGVRAHHRIHPLKGLIEYLVRVRGWG